MTTWTILSSPEDEMLPFFVMTMVVSSKRFTTNRCKNLFECLSSLAGFNFCNMQLTDHTNFSFIAREESFSISTLPNTVRLSGCSVSSCGNTDMNGWISRANMQFSALERMITNLYRSCKTRLVNSRPTLTRNSVVKIETTSSNLEEADSLNLNFQE